MMQLYVTWRISAARGEGFAFEIWAPELDAMWSIFDP
jgi:hypothetical protein